MKTKTKVVNIGDDPAIALLLRRSAHNYEVLHIPQGAGSTEEIELVNHFQPDVILLGTFDDLAICTTMYQRQEHIPIIMISEKMEERCIVKALDMGADDYIVKPFEREEFLARIRAQLRRARVQRSTHGLYDGPESLESEDGYLSMDVVRRAVKVGNQTVSLTPTEFELLKQFLLHAGKVLTHRFLLQRVWGPEYGDEADYLRVYVRQLRCKIEVEPAHPRYILTVPGVGYKFCASARHPVPVPASRK